MGLRTIMTGDVQKTALRLPRPLHERIHWAAAKNGRSMNTEIVERLESSFGADLTNLLGWEELKMLTPEQQTLIKAMIRALLPPNVGA